MKKRMIGSYLNGRWWIPSQWHKVPRRICMEIKSFYMRGMYGYAHCDLWGLDGYLAEWMPSALQDLKDTWIDWEYHGTDIDKMIKAFEIAAMDDLDDAFYTNGAFNIDKWNEYEKMRLDGMKHFAEHYRGLWY